MEEKLQELTERLYTEGVEKANREAETILAEARQKADKIMEEAGREAEKIKESATRSAREFQDNATAELSLSLRQALRSLEQQITDLISGRLLDEPLNEAFHDPAFLAQLVLKAVERWQPEEMTNPDLSILLPAKEREALDQFLQQRLREMLGDSLRVNYQEQLENGFRIGPSNGGYVVTFTQEDFRRFLGDFLRPRIKELLFDEW